MMKILLIAFLLVLAVTASGCIGESSVKTEEDAQKTVTDISKDVGDVDKVLSEIDEGLG